MSSKEEKFNKRRLRSAYFSVVVSISLVLFLVGMLGILVVNARTLAKEMRENFTFTLILKSDAPEVDVRHMVKELQMKEYVKEVELITKDEAAEEFQKEVGEEFVEFLGYNPLTDVLDIKLNAQYVVTDEIERIKAELSENPLVTDMVYNPNLVQMVNENIERIGLILAAGITLLLIVSIALINSSIRLTIYSQRFLIKTMQLVGATRKFVQKPFLLRSLKLGFIGGVISAVLLIIVGYAVHNYLPELTDLIDTTEMALVFLIMLVMGLFISWISTWFAVNKFLKIKTDEIHY